MKKLIILSLFLLAICVNSTSPAYYPPRTNEAQPISSCDWCRVVTPLIQQRLKSKLEHLQKEEEEQKEHEEHEEEEEEEEDEHEEEKDDDDEEELVVPIPEVMIDPFVPQNGEQVVIDNLIVPAVSEEQYERPVGLSEDAIESMSYRVPNAEIKKPRFNGKFKTFNRYSIDKETEEKEEKMEEEHHGRAKGYGHGRHGEKHGNKHGHKHGHGHGHGKGKGKCGEKARQEICQQFGQSKECHEFLSNYGKAIVKKIFKGEENICESLIDITLNRQNAFMCSPEMSILPYYPSDDVITSDSSFDLFVSLIKEMMNMNSDNKEVIQTTEVVYDSNGNVWQKTETLISNSQSSSWVDVVVVEQVGGVATDGQGFGPEYEVEQKCIFSRIKSAIVNEYHQHKTFYLSFFFTFAGLYCLMSCCRSRKCCRNQYQQLPQQAPTECCLEKEKEKAMPPPPAYDPVNNYPGNVVVQIGLVSPTKEKVVQRPI